MAKKKKRPRTKKKRRDSQRKTKKRTADSVKQESRNQSEKSKKRSFIKRLQNLANVFKSLGVIIFAIFVLAIIALLIIFSIHEMKKELVLVQSFEVPLSLENQGLTGRAIANKLIDEVNNIRTTAASSDDLMAVPSWSHKEIEIEIPKTGISFTSLLRFIRKKFGHEPINISGDLALDNKTLILTLRASGIPPVTITGELKSLDIILYQAAEYIYKNIEPFTLATYFLDKEDLDSCFEIINNILLYEQSDDKYDIYLLWGFALMKDANLRDATTKFEMAISLEPKRSAAYNALGLCMGEMRDYDGAIENYKKAAEIDPKQALIYNNWGYVLVYMKRYTDAINKFQKALELDPENHFAYNNWGYALSFMENYGEAIEKYRKATEINPQFFLPYSNWGHALIQLKDYKSAIEIIKKAIELNPKDAISYSYWGDALSFLKDYKGANIMYEKAVELEPNLIQVYVKWIQVKREIKDYEGADTLMKKLKNQLNIGKRIRGVKNRFY